MRGFLERVAALREAERLEALSQPLLSLPDAPEPSQAHPVTPCIVCRTPIVQTRARQQKCCSMACRSVANTLPPSTCTHCGKPYKANGHPSRRKFCSVACYGASLRKAVP